MDKENITEDFKGMVSVCNTHAEYRADYGLAQPRFICFSVDEYHIQDFLDACEKLIAKTENDIFYSDSVNVAINSSEIVHVIKLFKGVTTYSIRFGSLSIHYTQEDFESGIDRMGRALTARAGDTAKEKFIKGLDNTVEKAYKAYEATGDNKDFSGI